MSQIISEKVKDKINEDLSLTKNLTGLHLKIVAAIAIIWSLFQLWYASPFPFIFNFGMFKGLPARAIHLGFALTLAFLIYPITKGKPIALLVASSKIIIPRPPMINSIGNLKLSPITILSKTPPRSTN